jgi:mono/diheme cytochrome c family protein
MMRHFLFIFGLCVVLVMVIAGQRGDFSRKPPIEVFPDMDRQPKLQPQHDSAFFADRRSARLPVPGTIARGEPYADWPINTGRITGLTNFVENSPLPLTAQLLARGQERYQIYCTPCHGAQGDGKGITTKYGMAVIADLHDVANRRIVQQPDGQLFDTITHGKGQMQAYNSLIAPQDRWAIIAYVRALQRSRLATIADVPPEMLSKLPGGPAAAAAAPAAAQPKP